MSAGAPNKRKYLFEYYSKIGTKNSFPKSKQTLEQSARRASSHKPTITLWIILAQILRVVVRFIVGTRNSLLRSIYILEYSDRRASSLQLHNGSSFHIFYMLYVDLQVIGHKEFISEVEINIRLARQQPAVSLFCYSLMYLMLLLF